MAQSTAPKKRRRRSRQRLTVAQRVDRFESKLEASFGQAVQFVSIRAVQCRLCDKKLALGDDYGISNVRLHFRRRHADHRPATADRPAQPAQSAPIEEPAPPVNAQCAQAVDGWPPSFFTGAPELVGPIGYQPIDDLLPLPDELEDLDLALLIETLDPEAAAVGSYYPQHPTASALSLAAAGMAAAAPVALPRAAAWPAQLL